MQQISLIPDHRMGFSQISVDLSQNRGDAVAVAASQPAAKFRLLHAFSHTLRRTAVRIFQNAGIPIQGS
jgi:hypothetical protein